MSIFVCKWHLLMTPETTSSPRNDVALLGYIFLIFSTLKYQDGSHQKLRNRV